MKQILLIANHSTYLSPARGIQARRLINELAKYYEIHLVTSKKSIPDNRSYFENRIKSITTIAELPGKLKAAIGRIWLYFNVKDFYWFSRVKKVSREKLRKENIAAVITLSMNLTNADVGYYLKRKNPHLKWISFYSDPISLNYYIADHLWQKKILRRYEKKRFSLADRTVFPSKMMEEQYSHLYPQLSSKFVTIPHNYSPPTIKENRVLSKQNGYFVVRHLGLINTERSPIPLLDFILQNETFFEENKIRFEFIGTISRKLKQALANYKNPLVEFKDPIPYTEVEEKILGADLLLLIDANISNSPFLPSKLIEYLPYRIPILGLTPAGSESERVLQGINHFVVNYGKLSKFREIINILKTRKIYFNNIDKFNVVNIVLEWKRVIDVS